MAIINYLQNIGDSICVCLNYEINLIGIPSNQIIQNLEANFNELFLKYGQNKKIIVLLDLTQIDIHNLGIGISELKTMIMYLQRNHPEKLNRIIIYKYSDKVKFIIALLKSFVNPEISAKIIVDRNYHKFISVLLNSKECATNLNNNELRR